MPKALATAAMKILVSDSARRGNLERYLRSVECIVDRVGTSELEVSVEGVAGDQARRELEVYLKAWEVMNPGARAQIVD